MFPIHPLPLFLASVSPIFKKMPQIIAEKISNTQNGRLVSLDIDPTCRGLGVESDGDGGMTLEWILQDVG